LRHRNVTQVDDPKAVQLNNLQVDHHEMK